MSLNFYATLGASLVGVVFAVGLYVVEKISFYQQDQRRRELAKDVARLDSELAALKEEQQQQKNNLQRTLKEIDLELENNVTEDFEYCLEQLKDLCIEHPENPHLLWRIGRVHFQMKEKSQDKIFIMENINKGMQACQVALRLKPKLADVHKWLAILAGARSKHQPTFKEKILDGNLLKEHTEIAIKLNPEDPILHHMLGRFDYEMASLNWGERTVARMLFGELPTASYKQALNHLLEAEKCSQHPWKANKLSIAKCKLDMLEIEEAVRFLEEANNITEDKWPDEEVNAETIREVQ